jgi:hypothetical protein
MSNDPNSPIAILGQHLQHELPGVLFHGKENDFRLDQVGVIHALPRNDKAVDPSEDAQNWHRDGQSLLSSNHHDT